MKKFLLINLIFLCSIPNFIGEAVPLRVPASIDYNDSARTQPSYNMMSSLRNACETIREEDPGYNMCRPYINAKKDIDRTGKQLVNTINDYVPQELSGVTGILLKSLYERQVKIELRTGYGDPLVSISNTESYFKWNWKYDF